MKIIDSHSHWLPADIINNAHFFHKGWGDIEAQLKMMEASGIAQAVLSYPTSDAHLKLGGSNEVARIFNDNVARILKRCPDKFIGAAVLPIDNSRAMLDELKRSREELGFKAISLATSYDGIYLDDSRFLPLFKEAQAKKIPIFVHSQIIAPIGVERVKDPLLTPVIEYIFDTAICIGKLLMSGMLKDLEATLIFGYFGGAMPFLEQRFDATYQMLRGMNFVRDLGGLPTEFLKKVYVDTGGDKSKANIDISVSFFGANHILWGSDWPAKKDIAAGIKAVNDLDISQQDKENILGGNLEKLLAL
ncbi:MAG: amidohydrolase family protein [Candidatus Omnitrophica bacterium]|nr:amidohydrolase family protein [Candidatus Omnitrophota bacterium]